MQEDTLSIFAERLKEFLFEKNLSVKTFSKNVGIGKSSIYFYLNGNMFPSPEKAVKIANFFQTSLDYLFGLENDFAPKKSYPEKIVWKVKEAIDRSGKSRYRISRESGIPDSRLCGWYLGKIEPSIERLICLSKCVDCSLDFLLGRE